MTGALVNSSRFKSDSDYIKSSPESYQGPVVKIKIGNSEYDVSRNLLCSQSPYFDRMFKDDLSKQQSAELEEVDGIVSTRTFEMLLQWLYFGHITLVEEPLADQLTVALEFTRFANMLGIKEVVAHMFGQIKVRGVELEDSTSKQEEQAYSQHITAKHIYAATRLPKGHPVRRLVIQAVAEGYVVTFVNCEKFKFYAEIRGAEAEVGLERGFGRVTALPVAAFMGNEAAVEGLLMEGANVNARIWDRVSAVGLARRQGFKKIVEMLQRARAARPDRIKAVVNFGS
ncbi:hypothetical protein BJY04DRAFT_213908 [Aspergillus karnatakaensis]|uniref:uncharacterized protein n=1 Tax=Aspergillus karnatakaensis TaxID=1810916 RepID=UPI003CCE0B7E